MIWGTYTQFERPIAMHDGDTVEVVAGQAIFRHADGTIFDRCLTTVLPEGKSAFRSPFTIIEPKA